MIYIKLDDKDLILVRGGFDKGVSISIIVGGLIAFISGLLDGQIKLK